MFYPEDPAVLSARLTITSMVAVVRNLPTVAISTIVPIIALSVVMSIALVASVVSSTTVVRTIPVAEIFVPDVSHFIVAIFVERMVSKRVWIELDRAHIVDEALLRTSWSDCRIVCVWPKVKTSSANFPPELS